jgi:hypothetical protein
MVADFSIFSRLTNSQSSMRKTAQKSANKSNPLAEAPEPAWCGLHNTTVRMIALR